jgi:hypothetical protein
LRQAGLVIFRHRRGMLFVSPIRLRTFGHESAGVSASINGILEKVAAAPGIHRKQLAEQLAPAGAEPADLEKAKLPLASDLHWLVSEGYVIEFNDGSLDLPRAKPPPAQNPAEEKPAAAADAPNESSGDVPLAGEKTAESVTEDREAEVPQPQSEAAPVLP